MRSILVYLFILFLPVHPAYSNDTTFYILSSGGYDFPYYTTAKELAELLNPHFTNSKIVPTVSKGSVDNVKSLEEGFADFIICQRDVLCDRFYSNDKPLKNQVVLFPLFIEGLQIFVKGDGNRCEIISFEDFLEKIKTQKKSFGIDVPNSTTNITTRRVFKLLGITREDFFNEEIPLGSYVDEFNSGNLIAFSRMSTYPIKEVKNNLEIFDMVTFSYQDLKKLENRFTDLHKGWRSS